MLVPFGLGSSDCIEHDETTMTINGHRVALDFDGSAASFYDYLLLCIKTNMAGVTNPYLMIRVGACFRDWKRNSAARRQQNGEEEESGIPPPSHSLRPTADMLGVDLASSPSIAQATVQAFGSPARGVRIDDQGRIWQTRVGTSDNSGEPL